MEPITLDFSSSYRAITDDDIRLSLTRNVIGFNGDGIPMREVVIINPPGDPLTIPAREFFDTASPYQLEHNPRPNRLDLVDDSSDPGLYLRFQVAVDPPPIWEDYVEATYVGPSGFEQFAIDSGEFNSAIISWYTNILSFALQATQATLGDSGGTLAEFSSTSSLVVEDFVVAWHLFPLVIFGSAFGDVFNAGDRPATIHGVAGDDLIGGSEGGDKMFGGSGIDSLYGGKGADGIGGDRNADSLFGGTGNDSLDGNEGNDTLDGGKESDRLRGLDGDDSLIGGAGKDNLTGGNGVDTLVGGDANDSLFGSDGNDELDGGVGADTLFGGAESDGLYGGDEKDSLSGGTGADDLTGGQGNDTMNGGQGTDRFVFYRTGSADADRVLDFLAGTDRIGLSSATFAGVHAGLDQGEFRLGTAALDGDDRIIYDQASGRLYYDPDGTRNGASSAPQQLFAILVNHATLTYQDFVVI